MKRFKRYGDFIAVWEVTTTDENDYEITAARYFDPWEAVNHAIREYGALATISFALYKDDQIEHMKIF